MAKGKAAAGPAAAPRPHPRRQRRRPSRPRPSRRSRRRPSRRSEPPKVEPPKAPEPPEGRAAQGRATEGRPAPKAAAAGRPKPPPNPRSSTTCSPTRSPWAIGGGALAILAGIAAFIAARRRKTTKFEDSIISGTDIKTNTVFGSTGGGVVNTGENSLATDFSREGLGNIDTDEVDPIAEAEVYLAYGRDAQAEEILKEALKKDPQRQEIHLKLLEIHAQHNKPSAFETVAAELYLGVAGSGRDLAEGRGAGSRARSRPIRCSPNRGGRRDGRAAGAAVAAAAAAAPGRAGRAATTSAAAEPAPARLGGGREGDSGIDFRLDDDLHRFADVRRQAQDARRHPRRGGERAGQDGRAPPEARHDRLGAQRHVAGGAGAGQRRVPTRSNMCRQDRRRRTPSSISISSSTRPTSRRRCGAAAPRRRRPVVRTSRAVAARPQAAIDLDKLDLSFDPDKATFDDPTPSVLDGQWHDAATKLDLAKAYQEMGDVEGAREILQEVMHEGDEQQKAEAQSLIAKLG